MANKTADCLSQLYSPKEDHNNGDTSPETINALIQEQEKSSACMYACPAYVKSTAKSLMSSLF